MKPKYLFLLGIMLTSCGSGETSTNVQDTPKPVIQAQITQTAALVNPLERGAKIYKRCRACHTLDEGGKHKVGPNLWKIYGAKAGAKDGFTYSKVMAASDVIWDEKTMDAYLTKPSEFMKGNRMSFIGLKKQEDRDAVQLYLKVQTTPQQNP